MKAKKYLEDFDTLSLQEKIERIFEYERKKFLGFIRQRVNSIEEAEDILQDVFANILAASYHVERPIENVSSWIFTAVRNRIIDSYRKKRADTFSDIRIMNNHGETIDAYENFIGDTTQNPESDFIRKSIWEAVQKGLQELPEEQRMVFIRNEFEGVSFKDMADETGININTLLARKRYAVIYLRKQLKDLYTSVKGGINP